MRNLLYDFVLILILLVLSLVGGAWADCSYGNRETINSTNCGAAGNAGCIENCQLYKYYNSTYDYFLLYQDCDNEYERYGTKHCTCTRVSCRSETSSDSLICLNHGNLWIDGECRDEKWVCENDGGTWNETTQTCTPPCNEAADPHQECSMTWNKGYNVDGDGEPGGGGYWQITIFECTFDSCAMAKNCTETSSFPAGSLTCDDYQDTTSGVNGQCVGVVGPTCIISCPNKLTKSCDCDGSCDHAKTLPACQCPTSSASGGSSASGSSSSGGSSASGDSSASGGSSASGDSSGSGGSSGSGAPGGDNLGLIEYNTRRTYQSVEHYGQMEVGYLSDIDRWQSMHNMKLQAIQSGINGMAAGVSAASAQQQATKDTLHRTNELIEGISGQLSDSVDVPDIAAWKSSADSAIEALRNPDTTYVTVDSLAPDTTVFKSKYGGLFLNNVYTRNGCYEFTVTKPQGNSLFARAITEDIKLNFGDLGGIFDMCAIARGLCRIAGAVLVLLISLGAYRSAFASGEG